MDNIFSSVSTRLFFSLASRDRSANFELLMKIYDIFTEGEARPVIQKDELVESLSDFIRERNFSNLETETEELIENQSPREKALIKINQFRKHGWLNEDIAEGFETNISLDGNVIPILETLKKVSQSNNQIEYTGYVYIIYNTLKQFDNSKSTALLEQVYKNTRELMGNLQGLNTKIKRFITELLQNPENSPQKILETLLVKYQDQVLYTVFNNLRTKDNPNRYSSEILSVMNSFLEKEKMDSLIDNYIETKNIRNADEHSREYVKQNLTAIIRYTINSFEYISELINIIDSRNTKYLKSANARLKFLLNNSKDVEGIIVSVLKNMKYINEENFDCDKVLNTFSVANADCKSLFERSFNRAEKTFFSCEVPQVEEDEREKLRKKLLSEDLFSKQKVASFVMHVLDINSKRNSSEIEIKDFDTLIMMIMVQIYSQDEDMPYYTELSDGFTTAFGFSMNSFDIIKRKQK